LLKEYVLEYGHCNVPVREEYKGEFLTRWISAQRNKKFLRTETQKKLLESLDGWQWDNKNNQ
jgi:hypothetical protein